RASLVELLSKKRTVGGEKLTAEQIDEIAGALLSGAEESLDHTAPDIELKFDDSDLEELGKIQAASIKRLPQVIEAAILDGARLSLRGLRQDWPQLDLEKRHEIEGFRKRL